MAPRLWTWDHNAHFHDWILRSLPDARGHALDIGCGAGVLLRSLAGELRSVTGIDADPELPEPDLPDNATFIRGDVRAWRGRADLITMVAVLHHLPLREALDHVAVSLNPGGRFLCVGLSRPVGLADWTWEAANWASDPALGLAKRLRGQGQQGQQVLGGRQRPPQRVRIADPEETLVKIRSVAAGIIPGAVIRRRVGYRYTLEWRKPVWGDDPKA